MRSKLKKEILHWAVSLGGATSGVGGEVVGRGVGWKVEVDESVTGRKSEGVVSRVAPLMVDGAFV